MRGEFLKHVMQWRHLRASQKRGLQSADRQTRLTYRVLTRSGTGQQTDVTDKLLTPPTFNRTETKRCA